MSELTLEEQKKKEVHEALASGDKVRIWKTMAEYRVLCWRKKKDAYQTALDTFAS